MVELDDIVGFKNRKIYQNRDYLCFSIDSLLLSYFTEIKKTDKKILEFGVGNGSNLLILSLFHKQKMLGIDIQEENIELAKKSIEYNKLEDQLFIEKLNIIDAYKTLGNDIYDVIICNPPYFDSSSKAKSEVKRIAKSEQQISLNDIMKSASILLKNKGRLYLIYNSNTVEDVFLMSKKHNLTIKTMRPVYYDDTKKSKVTLFKICKGANKGILLEQPIYLYHHGNKTEDYKKMMGEM